MAMDGVGDAKLQGGLERHGPDEGKCAMPELELSVEQAFLVSAVLLRDGPHGVMVSVALLLAYFSYVGYIGEHVGY
jgi:hypothetical protein